MKEISDASKMERILIVMDKTGDQSLHQLEEFNYLGYLFTSESRVEQETDGLSR